MMRSIGRAGAFALACFTSLVLPGSLRAAPPDGSATSKSKRANRELAAGGVLLALGFTAELSGALISTSCTAGRRCAAGFALAVGEPAGPNRYALVLTGPSSAYIVGRLVAAPLLISGFTVAMTGLALRGERASSWPLTTRRRIAWSLFGAGLGILVGSRALRAVFLTTGICQTPACVHGFDQSTLWIGRGFTFAGTGLLVQGASRTELGVSGGPLDSFGLSFTGSF